MMGRILYALFSACLLVSNAQANELVVADIAEPVIEIGYSFNGASLLVFGAIDCVSEKEELGPCDIIAAVRGPTTQLIVRRKERLAGIWVNGASVSYKTAPGYYAVATTRDLDDIAPEEVKQRLAISIDSLFLSPQLSRPKIAAAEPTFRAGLIDDFATRGLYQKKPGKILVREDKLFRAEFSIPAAVPVGPFQVDIYALRDGKLVAQTQQKLVVRKSGIEDFIAHSATQLPLLYGLVSLALTLTVGFAAAAAFRKA